MLRINCYFVVTSKIIEVADYFQKTGSTGVSTRKIIAAAQVLNK